MMRKTYSAQDLSAIGLSILPKLASDIAYRAGMEGWPFTTVCGRGGDSGAIKLYTVPEYVEVAIALKRHSENQALAQCGATANVEPCYDIVPKAPALSERQRRVAEARAAILQHVHWLAKTDGVDRAVRQVANDAAARALPPTIAPLVPLANDRAGTSRTLTRSTLYRWLSKFDPNRPNAVERLAPRSSGATKRANWLRVKVAPWAEIALGLYQRPQKPSMRWVHEQLPKLLPPGVKAPSYDSLRRFFDSMGNVSREVGRMGPREHKSIRPFVRRDKDSLWPGEVFMADGHTFDAEVAHPRHGRPFRPEITSVLCAGTRRLLGWSIDLAESGLAVLDALRVAVMNSCLGEIFYVDRGKGYCNAMISAHGAGLLSRLGMTLQHSLPYNSQARGAMERVHQSIWVRAAKELPTYMGRDMDPEAKNKIYKLTRQEIKQFGRSRALMTWKDFLAFAAEQVERYNDHPHTGLPRIVDPHTGTRRHMTPNEAWAEGVQEAEQHGRLMITLDAAEADHLFRPQRACRVVRGEIRLFGNVYFSHELTEYHGDGVNVGYDIHDPSQVWVHDAEGVLICKAQLDGNKQPMFADAVRAQARSVREQNDRQRAANREKRLLDKLNEVHEELHGRPLELENNPTPYAQFITDVPADRVAVAVDAQIAAITTPGERAAERRPLFITANARYEWLKSQSYDKWEESDCAFLQSYVQDPDGYALFEERYDLLGMAWTDEDQQVVKRVTDEARRAA